MAKKKKRKKPISLHSLSDQDIINIKNSDEKNFNASLQGKAAFDLLGMERLILNDLSMEGRYQTQKVYGEITPEMIAEALKNPAKPSNRQTLIALSYYLYNASGHYKRLLNHFATMATFDYDVEPIIKDVDGIKAESYKKKYFNTLYDIERMCLPHELSKILLVVFLEGIYYGYAYEDEDDFFFNKLDQRHCRHVKIQDGIYNVELNMSAIDSSNLSTFPPEARQAYADYLEDNKKVPGSTVWFRLDPKKAVCVKMDELIPYVVPFFIYLFPNILNIDDFKQLQKKRAEIDNYRIITMLIPLRKDSGVEDDVALSGDLVEDNVSVAAEATDRTIAIIPTVLDTKAIEFKEKTNDRDNVKSATEQLNTESGVNGQLFNGGNSASLVMSIENDASLIYALLRQIERWINRRGKLKRLNGKNYQFMFKFLPITVYNRDKVVDRYLKACQSGLPMKRTLGAALGLNPLRLIGADYLENTVLELGKDWRPLTTSHTQSSSTDNAGRPEKDLDDLSPEGVQTREVDGNNEDSRRG